MKKDIFGARYHIKLPLKVEVAKCVHFSSDPYVRIDLLPINGEGTIDSVLTRTKKKTLNPEWNEEFIFKVGFLIV